MQELDHEQRGGLRLDDGQEEEPVAVDADKVVVRGLQHGGDILWLRRLLLRFEKVVANTAADDALPVLLQEDISRVVNQKQAVDHFNCNNGEAVKVVTAVTQRGREGDEEGNIQVTEEEMSHPHRNHQSFTTALNMYDEFMHSKHKVKRQSDELQLQNIKVKQVS